ncbi:MAG: hypothetical protein FWB77_03085 [Treponema sp.]|nr:hypothetical protein [Treponema sp.]
MASKNRKSLTPFLLLIIICASCQSMPGVTGVLRDDAAYAPLDSGAGVYLFAHAKEARSIIEILPIDELKDRQTRQMLDMTDFVAAAVFPAKSGRRFQLTAWGRYPASNAGTALNSNKSWEKITAAEGYTYWYSKSNSLSLALNNKQAFAVSTLNKTPAEPVAALPGIEIPQGFNDFRRRAPLSCWIDNPAPALVKILSEAGIPVRFPVQKLFFNLFQTGDKFEAVIRLQFENASQARGIAAVLSLAGGFVSKDPGMMIAALLLANPPVQSEANVDIKTAVLNKDELQVLLNYFIGV